MMYSDDLTDLTFNVMRHVHRKMMQMPQDDKKMNLMQAHGLGMIAEHDGITMKEVAKLMKVSAPTATSFVNRLVKGKWIDRVSDNTNRKLVRLKLTESGRIMLTQKKEEKRNALRAIVSLLSEQDQKDLARIYRNLLTSLSRTEQ